MKLGYPFGRILLRHVDVKQNPHGPVSRHRITHVRRRFYFIDGPRHRSAVVMSLLLILFLFLIPIFYYLFKAPSIPSIPNATPHLPLLGNVLAFAKNPVQYLVSQRALHGDIFHVNLGFIRFVYFLGPEGTNAIFRGTERGGISQFDTLTLILGVGAKKCISRLSCLTS